MPWHKVHFHLFFIKRISSPLTLISHFQPPFWTCNNWCLPCSCLSPHWPGVIKEAFKKRIRDYLQNKMFLGIGKTPIPHLEKIPKKFHFFWTASLGHHHYHHHWLDKAPRLSCWCWCYSWIGGRQCYLPLTTALITTLYFPRQLFWPTLLFHWRQTHRSWTGKTSFQPSSQHIITPPTPCRIGQVLGVKVGQTIRLPVAR